MKLSMGAVISGSSISNLDHEGETEIGESQQYKNFVHGEFQLLLEYSGGNSSYSNNLDIVPGEMGTLSIYNYF